MAASTPQPGQPLPDRGDLVEMLLIHQRNLHTFLLTLLPHEDDVDDLLQQVCLALWQKKDSYAPDRLEQLLADPAAVTLYLAVRELDATLIWKNRWRRASRSVSPLTARPNGMQAKSELPSPERFPGKLPGGRHHHSPSPGMTRRPWRSSTIHSQERAILPAQHRQPAAGRQRPTGCMASRPAGSSSTPPARSGGCSRWPVTGW
jgi:hypothetical protein